MHHVHDADCEVGAFNLSTCRVLCPRRQYHFIRLASPRSAPRELLFFYGVTLGIGIWWLVLFSKFRGAAFSNDTQVEGKPPRQ